MVIFVIFMSGDDRKVTGIAYCNEDNCTVLPAAGSGWSLMLDVQWEELKETEERLQMSGVQGD